MQNEDHAAKAEETQEAMQANAAAAENQEKHDVRRVKLWPGVYAIRSRSKLQRPKMRDVEEGRSR